MNGAAQLETPSQGDVSCGLAFVVPPSQFQAAAHPGAPTLHRFRLYVAGDAQNAALALANLTAFCHAHLVDRHAIEIVDIFEEPLRALADRVYMTPTLVVIAPGPAQRIVGTLEDSRALQRTLGFVTEGT